jgi:acetyltransferase-like isoleucine patch superfamily enzyme
MKTDYVKSFKIGKFHHIGAGCTFKGNQITIGDHFYCSGNLRVGGGGWQNETANLTVGDRCVFHDNLLNVCQPIEIGNDVGLSPEVTILTHGFWGNILEGYPNKFARVKIGNNVIVGYRSIINPGVEICDDVVIGSGTVVTKSILKKGVYSGNPCQFIRPILEPTPERKLELFNSICEKSGFKIKWDYPYIDYSQGELVIDVDMEDCYGNENDETDRLRNYLRKYGIRIYTERPFKQ